MENSAFPFEFSLTHDDDRNPLPAARGTLESQPTCYSDLVVRVGCGIDGAMVRVEYAERCGEMSAVAECGASYWAEDRSRARYKLR